MAQVSYRRRVSCQFFDCGGRTEHGNNCNSSGAESPETSVVTENLVCMLTLSAGETDRGIRAAAMQRRAESQSGECKEQSGLSSRRDCFGS
jgi:hypothetical protein